MTEDKFTMANPEDFEKVMQAIDEAPTIKATIECQNCEFYDEKKICCAVFYKGAEKPILIPTTPGYSCGRAIPRIKNVEEKKP